MQEPSRGNTGQRALKDLVFWIYPDEVPLGQTMVRGHVMVVDLDERWRADVIIAPVDGEPVVVGLAVHPSSSDVSREGFPLRLLRDLRESEVKNLYAEYIRVVNDLEMAERLRITTDMRAPMRSRKRGPEPPSDQDLARLSLAYVRAVQDGLPNPVQRVAASFFLSTEHAYELLRSARKRGILSEAPRGKAGGELTERGQQLLE